MARKLSFGVAAILTVAVVGSMGVVRAQEVFPLDVLTPPVIVSVSVDREILWPPNHKMKEIVVEAVVEDELGPLDFIILSVTSDEPVTGVGDVTDPDWLLRADHTLQLRAERLGSGDGRTYTITIEATNAAGTTQATVEVIVPHDKGQRKGLLAALKAEWKAEKAALKAEKAALKAARKAEKAALKAARKAEKEALKAARRAARGGDDD